MFASKLFVETFDMVGCHTLNTIERGMGAQAPIYHMLHEQTVPWCPVKCKCPLSSIFLPLHEAKPNLLYCQKV